MNIAAIIAEYNPFHSGHAYHIEQTRALRATHVVAVMSGNFVQRGEPAFLEKHTRATAAIQSGVDLVVELPLPYAMASAQHFAFGAVELIIAMGCVNILSFGSESGNIQLLQQAAEILEGDAFSQELKKHLGRGDTFAAARENALCVIAGCDVASALSSPNNTLAAAYLQQLFAHGSQIKPITIMRKNAPHDGKTTQNGFASASFLRAQPLSDIKDFVASQVFELYKNDFIGGKTVDPARLDAAVLTMLRGLDSSSFAGLPDCTEGIENRIYTAVRAGTSLAEILEGAKTKRYTMARIRRIVMSAYLGIGAEMCRMPPPYIRILAANAKGTEILAACKKTASIPISHSLARLSAEGGNAKLFASLESKSTDLYTATFKKPMPCGLDYTEKAIYTK